MKGRRGQSAQELLIVISAYVLLLGGLTYYTMFKDRMFDIYRYSENSKMKLDSIATLIDRLSYENITTEFTVECKNREELNFTMYPGSVMISYRDLEIPGIDPSSIAPIRRNVSARYITRICSSPCRAHRRRICLSNGIEPCSPDLWRDDLCTVLEIE